MQINNRVVGSKIRIYLEEMVSVPEWIAFETARAFGNLRPVLPT